VVPRPPRHSNHLLSLLSSGGSPRAAAAGATSGACGGSSSSSALRFQRKQNRASFHTNRQRLLALSSSSKATITAVQEEPQNPEEEVGKTEEKSSVRAAAEHFPDAANGSGDVASKNGASLQTATLSTRDDDDDSTIQQLTKHWREHPACNPTVHFKSWVVVGPWIQTILHSELTQPYLGSRLSLVEHLHNGRFRLVRDHIHDDGDENTKSPRQKLILLHPDTPALDDLPPPVRELLLQPQQSVNNNKNSENSVFVAPPVTEGPVVPIDFSHDHFTAAFLLEQLLPQAVHPPPTAFETVGHVAHLNLRRPHVPYRHLIGQVLLATLPAIETVIAKVGDVSGPYRTYEMQVLAGRHDTCVQLTESGVQLEFDLAQVYWCSRLSQERRRLLRDEILFERKEETRQETTKPSQHSRVTTVLADVFCGVGALCLQAAVQGDVEIWANDWNPHAVQALRHNAARNGVSDQVTRIQCGDAYDFLTDLGLTTTATTTTTKRGRTDDDNYTDDDDDDKNTTHRRLPDHVVMNFPLEAPQFLGALRWWPANSGVEPRVHVYTFARAAEGDEDETAPCLSAEDVAINLVADNLLPLPDAPTRSRLQELNGEYGCNVRVHNVRDVAPGKVVFCVSFTATNQLLRCMQGDF